MYRGTGFEWQKKEIKERNKRWIDIVRICFVLLNVHIIEETIYTWTCLF